MLGAAGPASVFGQVANAAWDGYGHDPQHTALSGNAAQDLTTIHWRTSVDLLNAPDPNAPGTGGSLYIHYGSLSMTSGNTVLVPVRIEKAGFEVLAFNADACASRGGLCAALYTLTTDYMSQVMTGFLPMDPL